MSDRIFILAGLVLMTTGVLLVLIAAIGVHRLPDAFQRMHSATKAGTLGTALTIIGSLLAGEQIAPATAIVTILFMLVTVPVAAQLLGRAAYVSGATIARLVRPDPLEEVVDRQEAPLEERLGKRP